jgi:hypothetical protein
MKKKMAKMEARGMVWHGMACNGNGEKQWHNDGVKKNGISE